MTIDLQIGMFYNSV